MLAEQTKAFIRKIANSQDFRESDLESYLDEHQEEDVREAWFFYEQVQAEGTPCEGCTHIGLRYSMFPCTLCTRAPEYQCWTDRFSPEGGDHENE